MSLRELLSESSSLLSSLDGDSSLSEVFKGQDNLSGMGDFHLRSAIKNVQLEKLLMGKGRKREKSDMANFREQFGNVQLTNGDPSELLSWFLLMGDSVIDQVSRQDLNDFYGLRYDMMKRIVARRVDMECKRDVGLNLSDFSMKRDSLSFREVILGSLRSCDMRTKYSNLRIKTEMIVMACNSISSRRDWNPLFSGHLMRDNNESGHSLYSHAHFKGQCWFIGGDLIFIKKAPKSRVEYDSVQKDVLSLLDYYPHDIEDFSSWAQEMTTAVEETENRWYVFSVDMMRMINDKVTERDITLRTVKWASEACPSIYPSGETIEQVFAIGDLTLSRFGNHAYKFFKVYESLMIGVLLSRCDSIIVDKEEFLQTTKFDLLRENPEFSQSTGALLNIVQNMESDHHVSQLYGLYRLWGHPLVNSRDGLQKVKKVGTAPKNIMDVAARKCGWIFKEEIFTKYRQRWGRYPAFSVSKSVFDELGGIENSYILDTLIRGDKLIRTSNQYCTNHWEYVIPEKTFCLPESFNLTTIISDKAISPPKSYLIEVGKHRANLMDPYQRRGVLKWMNTDYGSCRKFLKDIDEKGLPDEHCVIGLYPKERELNSVPRMFSLMSSEMRNYVVVTEHMIADDLLPYFPQITMTNDLLDLTKKIYSVTRRQEQSKHYMKGPKYGRYEVTVCLNMDFEKWNLNMRKEATHYVFQAMGQLYGMPNLFNRTYEIFHDSYIYLIDESHKILLGNDEEGNEILSPDGDTSYTGHIGGFEGLRQKGWTIFTVVAIQMILEKYPVIYKLMGQGDNQVLMLTLFSNNTDLQGDITQEGIHELKVLVDAMVTDMDKSFRKLGLPLKTLESWRSEDFFLYGKFPVKKGVPLSMSLKKICRAFPFSNDDNMNTDNVLGSIFTNAQSASMSDVSHMIPYYAGLMESALGALQLIDYHPMLGMSYRTIQSKSGRWVSYETQGEHSKVRKLVTKVDMDITDEEFAERLCLFPKSLGGSNGITEYEFLMRGFPDNQTRDLTYLVELYLHNRKNADGYVQLLLEGILAFVRLRISKGKNLDFLVEDPCAINILQPQTPLTLLRKEIKRVLGETTQFDNRNFMELFSLTGDDRRKTLLKELGGADRLFPRMLHDCYAASLFGFVEGIVSKVDKTVTVQRMCLDKSGEDIMRKIMRTEENYIQYLHWRGTHIREEQYEGEPDFQCPTNYIRWARNFGWGKEVLGVTVPYPSHTLRSSPPHHALGCTQEDYMSAFISDYTPTDELKLVSSIGKAPPYLGSYTKEKVKSYDKISLYGAEPILNRVIRLLRALSWGNLESSNLKDYLENLMESVSDIDPDLFLIAKDDIGGSIEHRYRDAALKHGALSSNMYGLGTWMHLSTDSFTKYSKGSKNVTLHFQAMLCWIQTVVQQILLQRCHSDSMWTKEYHFHLNCEKCIVPVEYEIPDILPIPKSVIPSLKGNPYCYVKDVLLTEKDRSVFRSLATLTLKKEVTVTSLHQDAISYLFHEYWAREIVKDLMGDDELDASVGTGVMEISKYPRIAFLRINVKELLIHICEMMLIKQMRSISGNDPHHEKAISIPHTLNILLGELQKRSPGCFLGISVLFSWPSKRDEISELSPTSIPRTLTPDVATCTRAAKSLLLDFIENNEVEIGQYACRYVNWVGSNDIGDDCLRRYLIVSGLLEYGSCSSCRRRAISLIDMDMIPLLDGSEKCIFGHCWFDKRLLLDHCEVISISEDVLSKNIVRKTLLRVPREVSSRERLERMESMLNIKRSKNVVHIITQDMVSKTSEPAISMTYPLERHFLQTSRLHRIIPYDLSSGYRTLEILIHLDLDVSDGKGGMLVLGDGIGNTSYMLSKFTTHKVMSTSLVDCTIAFPQTFVYAENPNKYLEDSGNVDVSLSKKVICNILDKGFQSLLARVSKIHKIKMILSEIEFEHAESQTSDDVEYDHMAIILTIWKAKVEIGIIKLRLKHFVEIIKIMNSVSRLFKRYDLLVTPFLNCNKGEFYLVVRDPQPMEEEGEAPFFSGKTIMGISNRVSEYISGRMFSDVSDDYYREVNNTILTKDILIASEKHLEEWFSAIDLTYDFWQGSYTRFFSKLLVKGVPKSVLDMQDMKDKYQYENLVPGIFERILCLGLGRIRSMAVILYHLSHINEFLLLRLVDSTLREGEIRRRFNYVVVHAGYLETFVRKNKKINVRMLPIVSLGQKNNVDRYVPLMNAVYERAGKLIEVEFVDAIVFRYSRQDKGSIRKRVVNLAISKTMQRTLLNVNC